MIRSVTRRHDESLNNDSSLDPLRLASSAVDTQVASVPATITSSTRSLDTVDGTPGLAQRLVGHALPPAILEQPLQAEPSSTFMMGTFAPPVALDHDSHAQVHQGPQIGQVPPIAAKYLHGLMGGGERGGDADDSGLLRPTIMLDALENGAQVVLHAGPQAGSLRTEALWFLRGAPFAPLHPLHARVPAELLLELSSFDLETGRVAVRELDR